MTKSIRLGGAPTCPAMAFRIGTGLLLFAVAVMFGQVPATPVLDSSRVQVWDVTLTKDKPLAFPAVPLDTVVLFFTDGKILTILDDGQTSTAARSFGDAIYIPKGRGEKLVSLSNMPTRIFTAELKDAPSPLYANKAGLPPAFPRPGSTKVLDNDRLVVWNYTFQQGRPTPVHFHDKDALVIYRYDGAVKSTTPDGTTTVAEHTPGEVRMNKGNRTHFEELDHGKVSVITAELK